MIDPEYTDVRKQRWPYAALAVVVPLVVIGWWYCWYNQTTTLLLVRHAEKGSGDNPGLTTEGATRAQALVDVAGAAGVGAVYATEWCRTALTAEPLAASLGHEILIQPNTIADNQLAGCGLSQSTALLDPSVASSAALVANALSTHRGQTVLIVGHSNTLPEILEAAGAPPLCPEYFDFHVSGTCRIPDQPGNDEYHHLFVLRVPRWFGSTHLIKATYGS